jgi:CheY-like chemotaxis protein
VRSINAPGKREYREVTGAWGIIGILSYRKYIQCDECHNVPFLKNISMNILLVDDEPHYLILLGDFLRNQGWTILTAENGGDALDKIKEHRVDIVISDIYMPVVNGIELQKSLKKMEGYADVPFIFVSAYADSSTLSTLDLSETVKYLSKSVSPAKLREWIIFLTTPPSERGKHPGEEIPSRTETKPMTRDPRTTRRR